MPSPLVRCEGIAKRFGHGAGYVLRDVSFDAFPGEAVHVRGANGSGKTTLLRLIAGVTRPTAGEIQRSAYATGWAPTQPVGGSALTAMALLASAVRVQGAAPGVLEDLLVELGLIGHLDDRLRTRSAGTRRKVNVAFALTAPDPALLVLDEPWAGLDEATGAALTSLIERRCQTGSCVVFTDHGHAAALPAVARIVEVRDGGVRPVTLRAPGLVIEATLGGERRQVAVSVAEVATTLNHLLDGGWSIVGVRRT